MTKDLGFGVVMRDERTSARRWFGMRLVTAFVVGFSVVRLGLGWTDTKPYSSWSEAAYAVVAVAALTVWWGGSLLALAVYRRRIRAVCSSR